MSSPIFAEASKHVNAFRLIALGLGVWTLSTAGCGISIGDQQHSLNLLTGLYACSTAVLVGSSADDSEV